PTTPGAPNTGAPGETAFGRGAPRGARTPASSPETQQMIDRAIAQFRQNMQPYLAGPVPPTSGGGYCPGAELVTAYFPRPTAPSVSMIADLIHRVTDPNLGMADALVDILRTETSSILPALPRHGDTRAA